MGLFDKRMTYADREGTENLLRDALIHQRMLRYEFEKLAATVYDINRIIQSKDSVLESYRQIVECINSFNTRSDMDYEGEPENQG